MDGYTEKATLRGWLTAILELGAWLGAILSGFVAEVFSRKYGVLIATSFFIVGVVVQITSIAGGHESILAGRFITYVQCLSIIEALRTVNTNVKSGAWE